jgi:hypothetical protein
MAVRASIPNPRLTSRWSPPHAGQGGPPDCAVEAAAWVKRRGDPQSWQNRDRLLTRVMHSGQTASKSRSWTVKSAPQ